MPLKLKPLGHGRYCAVNTETGKRESPEYAGPGAKEKATKFMQARNMAYQRGKGNPDIPPPKRKMQ